MDATALDSLSKHVFVNGEFKNAVNVHVLALEHIIELLSLSNSAGEAVEKDTSFTLWVAHVVFDETNDELVRHEIATLHNGVSLFAKLSASSDGVTQHVASGEMADAKVILDLGALGSLTGAWWSNHDHVHGWALGALISALDLREEIVKVDAAKVHL